MTDSADQPITLAEHMRRIRSLVKRNARTRKACQKAVAVRWQKYYAKKAAEIKTV